MSFPINPNTYLDKTLNIIKSCTNLPQIEVAKKCIQIYDSLESYIYEYFDNVDDFPNAHHMGHYDHSVAMYILSIELQKKKESL